MPLCRAVCPQCWVVGCCHRGVLVRVARRRPAGVLRPSADRTTLACAWRALPGDAAYGERAVTTPTTTSSPVPEASGAERWWPWGVGLLVGLVVVGPGLSAGPLLSLDLLATPEIPVPNGMYGLGPSLSQRVPLFALLGVGSWLVGGPAATKAFLVLAIAVGFAGSARLARTVGSRDLPVGVVGQLAAAVLWAAGPFALTRIGAGHVNLLWVVAVLPWAWPRLCRPAEHVPSTYLASLALAIGGPAGGALGLTVALVALVLQPRPWRWLRPVVGILAPQAVWVLPTAVLLWAGAGVTGAGGFATVAEGPDGWLGLAVGNGFWRVDYQVGAFGPAGALAGVLVLAAALTGGRTVLGRVGLRSWQGAGSVVAALGLGLTVASAVPGVRDAYGWLSDLPFGAPLRESQRFSALWLVWAGPLAALGAQRWSAVVARARPALASVVAALPLAAIVVTSVPGWWGVEGRLEPVRFPPGWAEARAIVRDEPGTVLALPWSQYPVLGFARDRQVLNPLPDYLGGDVVSSYDPLLDEDRPNQEQVDARAVVADELARRLRGGEPVGDDLADLGVRWVVLAREPGWEDYGALLSDPSLRQVLADDDIDVYEVVGWDGPVRSADGGSYAVERPIPPLLRTDAPGGSVVDVAGAPGWLRGTTPVPVTADGRLRLPDVGGPVWFWPAAAIAAADLLVLVGAGWALSSRSRDLGRILAGGPARE